MRLQLLFSLFVFFILSACSTKSLIILDPKKNVSLEKANHWKLNARVAIRLPEENHTATLNWSKDNNTFDFHLSAAFGITMAHVIQNQDVASLEINQSETTYHQDAEFLLYNSLGWSFPIHHLSDWVKGLPSGDPNEKITRDSFDRIEHISFKDWEISFSKYKKYQGFILPKMINAKHPNLSLKVVAKNWKFYE